MGSVSRSNRREDYAPHALAYQVSHDEGAQPDGFFVNITGEVEKAVSESRVREGSLPR